MIFGDKKLLCFEAIKKSGKFIEMNIYLDSANLSYEDNSYYIYPLLLNIDKDIEFLSNDLSIEDGFKSKDIKHLYDIFFNGDVIPYIKYDSTPEIMCYDLSAKRYFLYAYQNLENIVVFGKMFSSEKVIHVDLPKDYFIGVLKELSEHIKYLFENN